ncbi:MAG: hypothetical protein ACTSWL_06365 [Promethearchaeota archaeon]
MTISTNAHPRRIYAFDVFRGFAILFMIILHAALHNWTGTGELESGTQQADLFTQILAFFVTIGAIYSAILGAVTAYMFTHRATSKRNSIKQLMLGGIITGLSLITMQYIFRGLLSADSGILFFLVKNGTFQIPDAEWFINSSSPPVLGWNAIIVTGVLVLIFKKYMKRDDEGNFSVKGNKPYYILGIIATLIMVITPFLRIWLDPIVASWIHTKYVGFAWILGFFVYDNFPLFPVAAFALYGAIVGLMLARKESPKIILTYSMIQSVVWLAIGLLGFQFTGGIHTDLILANTTPGLIEDTFRLYAQLGTCFIFFTLVLLLFEFIPEKKRFSRFNKFRFVTRYGMISLTAYVTEGIITIILRKIPDSIPVLAGWSDSLGNVLILGLISACIWGFGAILWEKVGYKFSFEWWIIQITRWLSGKKSDKYDLKRLKNPSEEEIPQNPKLVEM